MGAVPLSVPAARSGGQPTDTGSALRAASAAESGTGLGQRAASAAEAGRAADLTVWASSLRPRTPSGSSSASTWRSRECWTCSPRVRLRLWLCGGGAGGCRCSQGVRPRSAMSRPSLGLPRRSPLPSRLASPIAFCPRSGGAAGRRTRLEKLVRRGPEMEAAVRGGSGPGAANRPLPHPRLWGRAGGGGEQQGPALCVLGCRPLFSHSASFNASLGSVLWWTPLFGHSASFNARFGHFLSFQWVLFPMFWGLFLCRALSE